MDRKLYKCRLLRYETFCSLFFANFQLYIVDQYKKTERIQNKYEIERDYIKDKKSQFSVLNLTTTELSFRPFREFSKTECARSLSFFCICIAFIFVANLLFFSPVLYAFCFVRFYSSPFLSRSRVPFV